MIIYFLNDSTYSGNNAIVVSGDRCTGLSVYTTTINKDDLQLDLDFREVNKEEFERLLTVYNNYLNAVVEFEKVEMSVMNCPSENLEDYFEFRYPNGNEDDDIDDIYGDGVKNI